MLGSGQEGVGDLFGVLEPLLALLGGAGDDR
jgi:hypothetical protein